MPARVRLGVAFSAVAALYAGCFAVLAWAPRMGGAVDPIALGVTLDLTVTSAAIVWLIAVRKRAAPRWILVPVAAVGVAVAAAVLPSDQKLLATALAGVWALAELAIGTLLTLRIRRIVAVARARRRAGSSLHIAIEEAFAEVLGRPRLAAWVATDLALLIYAFGGWFLRAPADAPGRFSVHRRAHAVGIAGALVLLAAVETVAVHLFVSRASVGAAWILTGLSIYAVLWVLGDMHALRLSRLELDEDTLRLSIGLRWRATIPRDEIVSIEAYRSAVEGALDVSVASSRDVVVKLRSKHAIRGPLGITRSADELVLSVDDVEAFVTLASKPVEP